MLIYSFAVIKNIFIFFQSIVDEIENSWSLMVNQVVDSLKEDLPLRINCSAFKVYSRIA